MKRLIYIAVIEHMSGQDVHTATNEAGLDKLVAAYCRDKWDTTNHVVSGGKLPPPEDDKACIDRYFGDHENDSLTTHCGSVEEAWPTNEEVLAAWYRREFAESLNRAMDAAGGSPKWEDLKSQKLEDVAVILARNGLMFRHAGNRSSAEYIATIDAVLNSLPYLP